MGETVQNFSHALVLWHSDFAIASLPLMAKSLCHREKVCTCLSRPGDRSLGSCKSFSLLMYRLADELQSLYLNLQNENLMGGGVRR